MDGLKKFFEKYLSNILLVNIVVALLLNIIIEFLARKDITLLWGYITNDFGVFLVNTVIIFATLSIEILFRRRIFTIILVSILWTAIGIANGVILGQRMTPFTVGDLQALKEGFEMAITYIPLSEIIIYAVVAVLAILFLVLLFLKAPKKKEKVNYRKAVVGILLVAILVSGTTMIGIKSGTMDTFFPNLAYGFRDNGVPYGFLSTWLDRGVDKPRGYSKELIADVFTEEELKNQVHVETTSKETGKVGSNILFLQLESVIDPYAIEGIEMSKDPIPNLRKLFEENPSGLLTVPSMGAGTANTEFEVMTGYSAKLFGPGEYPHKSVLKEQTIESYPFVLKELGYATHAIHNHRGVFYGRNKVFANLGYDTFTSLEYMKDVNKTKGNWAKDEILTENILNALNSTEERDYIYTIGVEGHGRYPEYQKIKEPEIVVETELGEGLKWQYEYYVNLCHGSDKFVGELIEALSEFDEEVVLVIYGDHLPAIESIDDSTLVDRTMYQTDYVIWSNFGIQYKLEDKDRFAYQIGAEVFDVLDIHEGMMVTLHQNHMDEEGYKDKLQALQYDTIYGNQYIYNGVLPFTKTDLHMGIEEIKIKAIKKVGKKYFIEGENFNAYSKVTLDGKVLDTFYISSNLLGLKEKVDPEELANMSVSQVESGKEILSTAKQIEELNQTIE